MFDRKEEPAAGLPWRPAGPNQEPGHEYEYDHLIPDILSRMQERLPVTEAERQLLRDLHDDPGHDQDEWPALLEEPYLEAISGLERQT